MIDKKTRTVYLMIECEVEERGTVGTIEEAAIRFIDHAVFSKCMGMKGKGYRVEMFGSMIVQKPVVLPRDVKTILRRDGAKHAPLHQQLKDAIIEERNRPAEERFQDMIDRAQIDANGKVLLKGPWNEDEDE